MEKGPKRTGQNFFLWLARTSRGALRAPLTNTFLGCAVPCNGRLACAARLRDARLLTETQRFYKCGLDLKWP